MNLLTLAHRSCVAVAAIILSHSVQCALPGESATAPPVRPTFENSVTLMGANESNSELSLVTGPSVPAVVILVVKEPFADHPGGELRVLPFSTQVEPVSVTTAKIRTAENSGPVHDFVAVDLAKAAQIPLSLEFDHLQQGKIYKGRLVLVSGDLLHTWTLSLTTAGYGTLAVNPVGLLKFVRWPFSCTSGSFSFTVYDKSGAGPYHRLRARFEPAATSGSKSLTSNFTLDTLCFSSGGSHVDLTRSNTGIKSEDLVLDKARTFKATIVALSPGEYSGDLRFAADETIEDAPEAKLPLLIQVRHSWVPAVLDILIGSAFGWFISKYVVGARRSRDLSRQISELRNRAQQLARRSNPTSGWEFPSEAVSIGFARMSVELSRVAKLASSAMQVLFRGAEIEERRGQAEQRLVGLETLHETRLRVQPGGTDRPAAKHVIGQKLRGAVDLLDQATFASGDQAKLKQLLDDLEIWAKHDATTVAYQQALIERLHGDQCPSLAQVTGLPATDPVRAELEKLIPTLPIDTAITATTDPAKLKEFDQAITKPILLWREHSWPWSKTLAEKNAAGASLDDLFEEADTQFWKLLKTKADMIDLIRDSGGADAPQSYEIVEINMDLSKVSDFSTWQVQRHRSKVGWSIEPPVGDRRTAETDGGMLVQYFPSEGKATVSADLRWKGEVIPLKSKLTFEIKPNPEYRRRSLLRTQWTEYVAIGAAALFAAATALSTQYDSTFGSISQYLAIFVWAAGAGTGGNLFAQLGASSTPGGAAATLK
jgi:hypothetical protein